MKLSLFVAGKARHGPEKELTERFVDRIQRSGQPVGLGPVVLKEYDPARFPPKGFNAAVECNLTAVCVFDEKAQLLTSEGFANMLVNLRDQARRDCVFLIGGPDGIPPDWAGKADQQISLGRMTYPHMIARILLAEQIYRAISILLGEPYHRN